MRHCPVLGDFIASHYDDIVARTRAKVAGRFAPHPTRIELSHGVPLFLDQFQARLLSTEQPHSNPNQIAASASQLGGELQRAGFTVGQVVHGYGDICQAITELAGELGAQITSDNFRALNLCLDVAIAEAVGEFSRQREQAITDLGFEQLGFLAHELRNLLNTACLAFEAVRSGNVGVSGSTGSLLGKSLEGMRDLVTRSLAEVRLQAGPPLAEHVLVAEIFEEIEIAAMTLAQARDIHLVIEPIESGLAVEGDSQIIASIITNLVQNACKFTHSSGHVTLTTRSTAERVLVDVIDECGGLPAGKAEELFRAYEQRGADRSGLGLGLAISLKGATAIGATLSVRDMPGTGCVFTVDLRRAAQPT